MSTSSTPDAGERGQVVSLLASDLSAGVPPLRDAIYEAICQADIPFHQDITTAGTRRVCDSLAASVVNVLYERIDLAREQAGGDGR